MAHTSATQPRCRVCGIAIKKVTRTVRFGRKEHNDFFIMSRTEHPKSREEAQRLLGGKVVSVRWFRSPKDEDRPEGVGARAFHDPGFDYIDQVTMWDGESYDDEYFCNGNHAKMLGYASAKSGFSSRAYREAMARFANKA